MHRYHYSSLRFIAIQLFFYSLFFWLFADRFRFAFGPDFVSYASIAKKYAAGNWSSAVNSWWSPAYSWLLSVLSVFTSDALTANKILQFLAGLPAVFLLRNIILFHSKEKKDIYAEWLMLACIPALVFWALSSDTPDFCSAVLLLWFFLKVLTLSVSFSYNTAITAGLAGALAYFFKSYNFYFIVAFGLLVLIVELFRQRKPGVLKSWMAVAVPFMFFSAVWILVLYGKYNKLMISSIGWHKPCTNEYVLGIKHNAAAADCAPLQFDSANIVSNWETPGHYPVSSISHFLVKEDTGSAVLQNAKDFFGSFISKYQLFLLVLLVIMVWGSWRRLGYLYLLFWTVYCGGYFFFHLEPRFFIMPSLLLMAAISISFLRATQMLTDKWLHAAGLLVITVLFVHSYLYNIQRGWHDEVQDKVQLFRSWNKTELKGKRLAATAGLYDAGIYVSFFYEARFYGALTAPENDPASLEQLKKNNIDYLLTTDAKGFYSLQPIR